MEQISAAELAQHFTKLLDTDPEEFVSLFLDELPDAIRITNAARTDPEKILTLSDPLGAYTFRRPIHGSRI